MINAGDVSHFVSVVAPSAILSVINAYPISMVIGSSRNESNEFLQFVESFNNHIMRLQELVINDIVIASAGRILTIYSYLGMKKTRMDQIDLVISSIASAAIDAAKTSIENGDTVVSIVLEAILRDSREYESCYWISKETTHLLHSLVIEEFEEKD